jgi:NAD+ synthetase
VAAICRPVCDDLNIKLLGRSLPHTTNKPEEQKRALNIGRAFCHDFDTFSINDQFQHFLGDSELGYSVGKDEKFNKIAEGNIKARIRMIHLYDLAYRTRGMVLSTDNYSELMVGFWTLHGDVGDYGLIQNLWKTEVYDLSNWLCNLLTEGPSKALKACVEATPTDGLGITNSDLDQLGASSYDEVDKILKTWLTEDLDSFYYDEDFLGYPGRHTNPDNFFEYRKAFKYHPVVQRHIKSGFKRLNPINIKRERIFR